jgi:proprotein convertase subtilisin/kexin type 5
MDFPTRTCLNPCAAGRFNNATNFCDNCNSSCSSCTGYLISNCLSCNVGWYLNGATCVVDCQPLGFWNNNTLRTCDPCYVDCTRCTGRIILFFLFNYYLAANNQCTACVAGLYLNGGKILFFKI